MLVSTVRCLLLRVYLDNVVPYHHHILDWYGSAAKGVARPGRHGAWSQGAACCYDCEATAAASWMAARLMSSGVASEAGSTQSSCAESAKFRQAVQPRRASAATPVAYLR